MPKPESVKEPQPVSVSYRVPRYRISLVREASYSTPCRTIAHSREGSLALRPLFEGLDREHFVVCCLDAKHAMIGVNVVAIGSLSLAIVHPREVLKPAILMNASALICAHNHPSGDPTPSPEDRVLTHRLKAAAELLGITLLDHLIFGEGEMFSFADQGWPVSHGQHSTKGDLS